MINKGFLAFIYIFLFYSCFENKIENPKKQEIIYKTDSLLDFKENQNDTNEIGFDTFIFDSIKINGKYPLCMSLKELKSYFGKPDSIVNDTAECGNSIDGEYEYKTYYYKYISFEVSKNKAQLLEIQMCNNNSIKFKDRLIDSNFTLKDFYTFFPNSAKLSPPEKLNNNVTCWVNMFNIKNNIIFYVDGKYIFLFKNNKLINVSLWWDVC